MCHFYHRRSVRLSAQKDLEQKEKNHVASVEMKARRCTAHTTDYPPNKKMKVEKTVKSTEEQELEKSLRMQQEVVEMRKKNEEFKKLALAGPGQLAH